MIFSKPNYLPKDSSLSTNMLGIRTSIYGLLGAGIEDGGGVGGATQTFRP